jgi:hypothetical protein
MERSSGGYFGGHSAGRHPGPWRGLQTAIDLHDNVLYMIGAIAYNVSLVCDAAPRPTGPRGRCGAAARRSAAEPEAPSEAPMHIRAVIRSCAVLLVPLIADNPVAFYIFHQ